MSEIAPANLSPAPSSTASARTDDRTVTVIGAGMAGAACAVELTRAGVPVRVLDRGRGVGGRMASRTLHERAVDLGAGYFTVRDDEFAEVVAGWRSAGLAREWTDTFSVLEAGRAPERKTGPVRWATPGGLRSLVAAMLADQDVRSASPVTELPTGDVVVAMPDPQAARLVDVPSPVDYLPVITVVLGFTERGWDLPDAAFVTHPDIEFLADDGSRRGDGAPVLVAHSTPDRARRHLADPDTAVAPMVAGVGDLLGVGAPAWTHAHRWTFAKPADARPEAFFLREEDGRWVGLAGDQWCPQGSPRVESAWRSGTDLARALVAARG
ncbi:NAD(P)-binding protein [Nakamurella flavida]|uniref:NAD(P)-binding protein n=1 Tax=Nakamurella flavida TaxID=363630 RepID=A0A938YPY1_9ACTN|nr:NAD(P)-binding protein [Nakamurella flavida]MBM9477229.1 NAD(P)-binding protein [Nakamurella flavida]MDP9780179.1 putative NAD/FAD-dependent oxidoreductase [Nakamurella flavida]